MKRRSAILLVVPASMMLSASAYNQYSTDEVSIVNGAPQSAAESSTPPAVAPPKPLIMAWGASLPLPSGSTLAAPVAPIGTTSRALAPAPLKLVAPLGPVAPAKPVSVLNTVTPATVKSAVVTPSMSTPKSVKEKPTPTKSSSKESSPKAKSNGDGKKVASKAVKVAVKEAVIEIETGISTRIIDSISLKKEDGTQEKCAVLTFDDGPDPVYTPQILAILKKHDVKATFCVVGRQVKKHPDLVRQIVAEGHQIANHSMNHDEHIAYRSVEKIKQEVLAEVALIDSIVPGVPVEYFRAPGGTWNMKVRKLSASWGMKPLGWSVDTKDWQQPGVESIVNTVKNRLKAGGVILMHDGGGNRSQSVAALKQFLPTLQEDGYKFILPQ